MPLRRLLARLRRAPLSLAPVALLLIGGSCNDAPTGAGGNGTASGGLALSLNVAGASKQESPGLSRAFDRVDQIRVAVFRSEEAVIDTTFDLSPTGTDTDLRLPITLTSQLQKTPSFGVIVELLHTGQRLFEGSGTAALAAGKTTQVDITLNPVADHVVVPDSLPTLTAPGDSLPLGGAVVFATGDTIQGLALTWSTPDTAVARVRASGYAVAVGEGAAKFTGSYGGFSGTVDLNVHFVIGSIEIAPIMVMGLVPDSTVQLTATVRDAHANPLLRPVSWSVADTTVATVDSAGLLRGRRPGNTTVTARSGEKSAEIPVAVLPRAVTRLMVSPPAAQVIVGDSVALTAQAFAANGSPLTGRAITWSTASGTIAAVSAGGVVRGRRAGTTQIYATVESLRDSARIDVTGPPAIGDSVAVDSITVSSAVVRGSATPGNGPTVIAMRWGTSAAALENLAPTLELGADTLRHALRFALSDLSPGTTYHFRIEATNAAGRDSTVGSFTTGMVPVASLAVTPDSAQLAVGDSVKLSAVARGAGDEVLTGRPVTWTSSDTAVAKVSTGGVVHARAVGGAYVRGTSSGFSDSTRISVIAPPTLRDVTVTAPGAVTAQVTGFYNPGGSPTDVWARWGTSAAALSDSSTNIGITDAGADFRFFIDLSGLAPATTYYYRVHARNAVGADSTPVQSFATPDTVPPSPTELTAVPTGESIYLSWLEYGTRATSFRIERSADGSPSWSTLATVGTDSLKYVDGWDGTGTHNYSYRVLACREVGCSPPTDTAQAPLDALLRTTATGAAAVGREHTCALQPVSGDLLCWGANDQNQINSDAGSPVSSPIHVQSGTKYVQIAAGYDRTCGLRSDGRTYCWGAWTDPSGVDVTPQLVPGGITFQTISVGADHACGVTAAGAAYCWGSNHSYQLGQADSTFRTTTPVLVPGGLTFRSISAGFDQTCGVTTTDQAYCWGWNGNGQLGIDDSDAVHTHSDAPFAVAGGHSFATVSAGDQHTCGVTTTGQAYCWGDDGGGQLGTGSEGSEPVPAPVAGGLTFSSISAGSGYTRGLATTRQAYCWGINEVGALGTGNNNSTTTPALVAGGHSFTSVTAHYGHSCGVAIDQQLYCWGWNGSYQLGDESGESQNAPVNVRFSVPSYLPGS
jgi:alpha-tubulin suppressor-like RCC1 family protein/uncharacterized protein YjdB